MVGFGGCLGRCFRGPPPPVETDEEAMPSAAPPATHLKQQQQQQQQQQGGGPGPRPGGGSRAGATAAELEDEGFTILSEEELREAVAHADSGNGHGGSAGPVGQEQGVVEEEEDEEWDCHFTDLAVLSYPQGQAEGEPAKVNEYEFESHLGAGSFGSVRLARRVVPGQGPPYKQYAVKAMSKQRLRRLKKSVMTGADGRMAVKTGEDLILNEINVMRHLYHRNVVLLFEVISDPTEDSIFMVMEFLEGGPAMKYDKARKRFYSPLTNGVLTEALAAKLFFGLVSGLQYLHAKRVCHRDIKPENLLLTDGTKLRITDFGCALRVDAAAEAAGGGPVEDGLLVDTAGTFTFLAPECCTGEPYSPWPADVWAAGVTLYCFVFGRLPFQRDGVAQLFADIQEQPMRFPEPEPEPEPEGEGGEAPPPPPPAPSPGLAEMLHGLFEKDPAARWPLDRLRAHAWLETPRLEDEEEDRAKAALGGQEEEEAAAKAAAVAAGKGKDAQV